MSLSAPTTRDRPVVILAYFDVVLLVVAAPIMLLIGVPALGYLAGAGAWILLRLVGVGVERTATSAREAQMQISIRLGYMLGRLFLLALAVIVARNHSRDAGLTALAVVVAAFTIQLALSAVNRPRSR
jgi:hypothetical protein